MKIRLLHAIVRAALALLRGIGYIARALSTRLGRLFNMFAVVVGAVVRTVCLVVYRIGKSFQRLVRTIVDPAEQRFFAITAHRYSTHVLMVLIVLGALTTSIRAAQGSPSETLNTTPLSVLVSDGEDELFVEQGFESRVAEGSPVPFALDVPQEVIEEELLLALDDGAVWAAPAAPGGAATRTGIEQYVVREGDTVSSIAERFGVSIGTVLWENKLGPYDVIRPGRTLTILPVSGVSYTVGRGETIGQIAAKFQIPLERIAEYNDSRKGGPEKKLAVGTVLVIPGGRPITPVRVLVVAPRVSPRLTTRPTVLKPPSEVPTPTEAGTRLLWPTVSHHINQYFSWRHPGLDIHGDLTSPLYAADDGVAVIVEYKRTGYGQSIVIDHGNGTRTRYGHASKIFVEQGETVTRGQVIAMMGSTGRSTGPHLHFEVIVAGRRVNPFGYTR